MKENLKYVILGCCFVVLSCGKKTTTNNVEASRAEELTARVELLEKKVDELMEDRALEFFKGRDGRIEVPFKKVE